MLKSVFRLLLFGALVFSLIKSEADDYIKQVQDEEENGKDDGEQIVYQNPSQDKTEIFHKYFLPPVTGEYKFLAKCSGDCDVYLGDDHELSEEKIISVDGAAATKREFAAEAASHIIYLKQGQKYLLKTTSNSPISSSPMIGVQLPDDTRMMPIKQNLFFQESGTENAKFKQTKHATSSNKSMADTSRGRKHYLSLGSSKPKVSSPAKHSRLNNVSSKKLYKKLEQVGKFIKSMEDKKVKNDKLDSGITDIIKTLQDHFQGGKSPSKPNSLMEVAGIDRSHIDDGVSSKERIIIQLIDALKRNLIIEDKHRKMKEYMYQRKLDRLFHEVNKLKSVIGSVKNTKDVSSYVSRKSVYSPKKNQLTIGQKRHHKQVQRPHKRYRKPELNFVDEIEDSSLIDDGHGGSRLGDDEDSEGQPMSVRKITPSAASAYEKAMNLIPESEDNELMEQGLAKASTPESDISAIRQKQSQYASLLNTKKPQSLKNKRPRNEKQQKSHQTKVKSLADQQMMKSGDQTNPEPIFVGQSGRPSPNHNFLPEYYNNVQQGKLNNFGLNNQASDKKTASRLQNEEKTLATSMPESKAESEQKDIEHNVEPENGKSPKKNAQNNVEPETQNPVEVTIGENTKENLQSDKEIGRVENEMKVNPNDMKKSNDHFETDKPFYRLVKEEKPLQQTMPDNAVSGAAHNNVGHENKQSVVNFRSEDLKALEDNLFAAFEKRIHNKGLNGTIESLKKTQNNEDAKVRDFEKPESSERSINNEDSSKLNDNIGRFTENVNEKQNTLSQPVEHSSIKDSEEIKKPNAFLGNSLEISSNQQSVTKNLDEPSAFYKQQNGIQESKEGKIVNEPLIEKTGRELIKIKHPINGQFMGNSERAQYIKKYENLLQPEENIDIFSRKAVLKYKKPEVDKDDRHYWDIKKSPVLDGAVEKDHSVEEKQNSQGFVRSSDDRNEEGERQSDEKNHKYVYFRDDKIYIKDPSQFLRKAAGDSRIEREKSEGLRHRQDDEEESEDRESVEHQESPDMRGDVRSTTLSMANVAGSKTNNTPTTKSIQNQNEGATIPGPNSLLIPESSSVIQDQKKTPDNPIDAKSTSLLSDVQATNTVEVPATKHERIQIDQSSESSVLPTKSLTDREGAELQSVAKMSSSINAMSALPKDVFSSKESDGEYLVKIRNLLGEITFLKEEISSMKRDNVYTNKDKDKMENKLLQKQNLLSRLQTKRKEIARPSKHKSYKRSFKKLLRHKKLHKRHHPHLF